jgi:membrane carboxypeptidase/penicillin-binding protein PbpC
MDPKLVWQTVENLGLTRLQLPPENGEYQIILQGGNANLVEVSQAYGVLANQGILTGIARSNGSAENSNSPIAPQVVLKVLDDSGSEKLNCSDQLSSCRVAQRPVISQELSYLITDILSDETARWPSLGHPNFLEIGHPAAAKIGMTSNQDSLWTLGYTPDLLTAVWVGSRITNHEDPISPDLSAGLWHAIMQFKTKDSPGKEFPVPGSINELPVCYPSGLLPTEDCPRIVNEIFISGSEPTQVDNLYHAFLINRESGLLATIFTPPAFIDEQVFMTIPPEAQVWADQAGILQVPTDYDLIGASSNNTSEVQITSPTMFNTINGSVPVIGRAAGEGFQSYRLQYGSGLNPVAWFQLGGPVENPVQNGKLGTWNTQGLSGLFVLQLIVTYENDRVETSIIQVRIDNQDPEIRILYPKDKQNFKQDESETITLQVEVGDDLGLNRVEFYIDSELTATLNSPPYVLPWRVDVGEHYFKVIAYDQAGNTADAEVRIMVE